MQEACWSRSKDGFYETPWEDGALRVGRIAEANDTLYVLQYVPSGKSQGYTLRYSMASDKIISQLTPDEVETFSRAKGLFRGNTINSGIKACLRRKVFKSLDNLASR